MIGPESGEFVKENEIFAGMLLSFDLVVEEVGRANVPRFRATRVCLVQTSPGDPVLPAGGKAGIRTASSTSLESRLVFLRSGVTGVVQKEPRKEVTGTIEVNFNSETGLTKESIDEPLRHPEVVIHDLDVMEALQVSSFHLGPHQGTVTDLSTSLPPPPYKHTPVFLC